VRYILASMLLAAASVPPAALKAQTREFSSVIVEEGHSLRPDERTPYRSGQQFVRAFGNLGFTLCTEASVCTTLPEKDPPIEGRRWLSLDLSNPVPGSGAVARGVLRAYGGGFGVFWMQDTTRRTTVNGREGWVIRSMVDIPVDSAVRSHRVAIGFFPGGKHHVLQFGPWTAGQYQGRDSTRSGKAATTATALHGR
jgi:hypothetical protein